MTFENKNKFLEESKIIHSEIIFKHSHFGEIYRVILENLGKQYEILFEARCDDIHPGRSFMTVPKLLN